VLRQVGHPVQALSDVRRARARSAQIGGPDGITQRFQVSTYSGEPFTSRFARNLLSKDDWREALGDEAAELGPEVAGVGIASLLAGTGIRLAGTGPGPDGHPDRPASEPQGKRPAPDAGEEVAFAVSSNVIGADLPNVPLVHHTGRHLPSADQVPQPCHREAVVVVVIGGHEIAASGVMPTKAARLSRQCLQSS
jgi:hypothetical protein